MTIVRCWLAIAALVAATQACAQVNVAGVRYEPSTDLAGSTLALNGAGIRTRFLFKVYTAGLYLPRKTASAEEAIAAPGAKRISLSMLREVEAADLAQAFAKAIEENNDHATLDALAADLQRMNQLFAQHAKLVAGDPIVIDSVPGSGTVIRVKGAPSGEPFRDARFFPALLRIWLGPAPADATLKDALLGKTS
jgi:uncharacterized protein YbjT (DUF2867 family)